MLSQDVYSLQSRLEDWQFDADLDPLELKIAIEDLRALRRDVAALERCVVPNTQRNLIPIRAIK